MVKFSYARFVYRLMQRHIRRLEDLPEETDRLAADALEDAEEGAPLLHALSPESVDNLQTGLAFNPRTP
jgi:hypothetical protein